MLKGAIARRYAGAMFELARKQNALDRTLEDVKEIAKVFANRKLSYLLREPKIPAQRKETALRQALTDRVLPTTSTITIRTPRTYLKIADRSRCAINVE